MIRGAIAGLLLLAGTVTASPPVVQEVEGQPLAANVTRLISAYQQLGKPLPAEFISQLKPALAGKDARKLQELLDPFVMVHVAINPESRVKVSRGAAAATIQQSGYVPMLLKVVNESTVKTSLRISSPQSGPVYAGGGARNATTGKDRFLQVEMFDKPPMTANLSGLKVEYAIALVYSSEAGKREATFLFDVGQGTQDLGFRAEVPVLFDVRPAREVRMVVKDYDGQTTTGRFTFRDLAGHVYPPQAKRLAPDFFFQEQVYRPDGGIVLLPPGDLVFTYGRGPEYLQKQKKITIPETGDATIEVSLERWINPREYGFYSGDHHIHAAGCAHYTNPTEGVFAKDMFLHVKGEGLNVGCNLTWGPCYDFQRQFFEPGINKLSEPFTLLKYDIEISGFGSQALGHVCLLNLRDQTYPGSDGTKTKGWPTYTTPAMRWAKEQGGVTGYAHSASGLGVHPQNAATRLMQSLDTNLDGKLSQEEAAKGLFTDPFARMDANHDGVLTSDEVQANLTVVRNRIPNYAIPEMNGIGAQEICVTTALGVCDFISAMDTERVPEWNCWYHIMNCGFPLKSSGETDFPCISGSRVGQGRVYVHMGKVDRIDFGDWARGIAQGRSYISDGYAHALAFTVNDASPGYGDVKLEKAGDVNVKAKVSFASELPLGTAKGGPEPKGNSRRVELIVNGLPVAVKEVPADNKVHDLEFRVPIARSSWVALRQFPQMHTNPVNVIVGDKPIASRSSARWCMDVIEQLWRIREKDIAKEERAAAKAAFAEATKKYEKIAADAEPGS